MAPRVMRRLKITVAAGWYEGQEERHEGGHLQDDERHILERFPDEPPERLGRLGRDRIGAERLPATRTRVQHANAGEHCHSF